MRRARISDAMHRVRFRFARLRGLVTALLRPVDRHDAAREVRYTATWLIKRRRHRLAVALLDLAERRLRPHAEITRLRRTVPGYVGRVSRRHVRNAARQAAGAGLAAVQVLDEPVTEGISEATVAVVRHTAQPHNQTFIRKSIHTALPQEVRLYRSGLVAAPGRWFRAPAVWGIERQGKFWHLFLEDLPADNRPRSAAEFVNCARGLAELGARYYGDAAPEFDWLSVDLTFALLPHQRGIRACSEILPPADSRRLLSLFDRLCAAEADLMAQLRSLPQTLCHGDAHAGNLIMDPTQSDRTVMIDWQLVHVGPAGWDLGRLMSVPSSFARGAQLDPDACRQAYLDGLGAPVSHRDAITFASDFTLVWHSLRWWASQPEPDPGWLRPADVNRICRAAEALLS